MDDRLLELTAGLELDQLLPRLVGALRMRDCGHRALAFYLWELQRRRLCQRLGYPDAVSFAGCELGIGRRRAQELIAAGRGLLELVRVDAAFRDGAICWSKVRELLRVATVETEAGWVERAEAVSCRELRDLARRARPGEEPGDVGAEGGLPAVRYRVEAELDALAYEEWTQARRKLQAELGTELSDADAMRLLAQMALGTRADGTVTGRVPIDESIYKVVVDAERAHVRADDGPESVPGAGLEAAASDAAVSPALRRKILARDGHRCRRCGRKGGLQVHHVVWRSRGGPTRAENLIALCGHCHALVHSGELVVEGAVGPDTGGVRFGAAATVPRAHVRAMALRVPEPPAIPAAEPELTLDTIPAVVTPKWWLEHEHLFENGPGGSIRLKSPRARARAEPAARAM